MDSMNHSVTQSIFKIKRINVQQISPNKPMTLQRNWSKYTNVTAQTRVGTATHLRRLILIVE